MRNYFYISIERKVFTISNNELRHLSINNRNKVTQILTLDKYGSADILRDLDSKSYIVKSNKEFLTYL